MHACNLLFPSQLSSLFYSYRRWKPATLSCVLANALACSHAGSDGQRRIRRDLQCLRLEVAAIKFSLVLMKNAITPVNEGRREYLLVFG
jgi:hypothetical protein